VKIHIELPTYIDPADPEKVQRIVRRHGRELLLKGGQALAYRAGQLLDRLLPADPEDPHG